MTKKFFPTMNLRFSKRESNKYPGETGYKYILQQRWDAQDGSGRSKWIDVPRYDPYMEVANDAGRESQGAD